MDVLLLTERILKTIEMRESPFREFKSAWEGPPATKLVRDPKSVAKDIAETLVAFANADGGELLVGVEDDGEITGHGFKSETLKKLLNAPKSGVLASTPLEGVTAQTVNIENKQVLYFEVDKGTSYV